MKDVKIEKCQFCGGEEFIECYVASGVYFATVGLHRAPAFVTVCRDCGSVIRMFCKTPENLLDKKERKQ